LHSKMALLGRWKRSRTSTSTLPSVDGILILEALQIEPGLPGKALVKLTGKTYSQVAQTLEQLRELGYIEIKPQKGKKCSPIFLTELGKEQVPTIRMRAVGRIPLDLTRPDGGLADKDITKIQESVQLLIQGLVSIFETDFRQKTK